jgi:hypothetical protein
MTSILYNSFDILRRNFGLESCKDFNLSFKLRKKALQLFSADDLPEDKQEKFRECFGIGAQVISEYFLQKMKKIKTDHDLENPATSLEKTNKARELQQGIIETLKELLKYHPLFYIGIVDIAAYRIKTWIPSKKHKSNEYLYFLMSEENRKIIFQDLDKRLSKVKLTNSQKQKIFERLASYSLICFEVMQAENNYAKYSYLERTIFYYLNSFNKNSTYPWNCNFFQQFSFYLSKEDDETFQVFKDCLDLDRVAILEEVAEIEKKPNAIIDLVGRLADQIKQLKDKDQKDKLVKKLQDENRALIQNITKFTSENTFDPEVLEESKKQLEKTLAYLQENAQEKKTEGLKFKPLPSTPTFFYKRDKPDSKRKASQPTKFQKMN